MNSTIGSAGGAGASPRRTALAVVALIVALLLAVGLGAWIGGSTSSAPPDSLASADESADSVAEVSSTEPVDADAADDASDDADESSTTEPAPETTAAPADESTTTTLAAAPDGDDTAQDSDQSEAAAGDGSADESTTTTTTPSGSSHDTDEMAEVPDARGTDEVPESRAIVRNGQIFLEGAVPDEATGAEIEALAVQVLGPDNVINNYTIDERATDPNLGNITVEDTINFDSGESEVLPGSEGLLQQGIILMNLRPQMEIAIVGHTDSVGSDENNQTLSEERAEAVKTWMTERGADPFRIFVFGSGESDPIADNDTEDGRRLNRRIQFILVNVLGDEQAQ